MDNNLENNIDLKDKIISFYDKNKIKIYIFITLIIIGGISLLWLESYKIKKNNSISKNYIQATLHIASNENEKARIILHEIILSKNKFYSILALNLILEKNLISDQKKILEYFDILKKLDYSEEKYNLISLKKALYLFKISNFEEGNKLLKDLIEKDSNFKSIAEEVIKK